MKAAIGTVLRALIVAGIWGSIGVGVNLISAEPVPWIYEPPKSVDIAGIKVLLMDEKQAKGLHGNPDTVFVDSRNKADYVKSHVKGSIFLAPDDVEERFPSVEPLLPQDSRIVLYCYGPECDMAERVAAFLAQMGYKNLAVMSAGFPAWQKAGYPVETNSDRSETMSFREQEEENRNFKKVAFGVWAVGRHRVLY